MRSWLAVATKVQLGSPSPILYTALISDADTLGLRCGLVVSRKLTQTFLVPTGFPAHGLKEQSEHCGKRRYEYVGHRLYSETCGSACGSCGTLLG